MQAIEITAIGDADVLQLRHDYAEPEIATTTQIKVRLRAAGINPIDTKVRSKALFYNAQPPAIPGCDGAGEIVAIGDAVDRFQVGDSVWFCHGGLGREQGNYAEYTVLEQNQAELKPASIDFTHAAAAPLVLITAWEALFDQGRLQAADNVLIHAGAGGVGHVAIQLAKQQGSRVITTVGTEENAEFVRSLGADEVINYHQQDVAQQCLALTENRGIDLCLDTVGGNVFRNSIEAMAPYGRLLTLLDPGTDLDLSKARLKNLQIAFTLMLTPMLLDLDQARAHQGEILQKCATLIAEKKLKIHVSQSYALANAAEAHLAIEGGHTRGKLVLKL